MRPGHCCAGRWRRRPGGCSHDCARRRSCSRTWPCWVQAHVGVLGRARLHCLCHRNRRVESVDDVQTVEAAEEEATRASQAREAESKVAEQRQRRAQERDMELERERERERERDREQEHRRRQREETEARMLAQTARSAGTAEYGSGASAAGSGGVVGADSGATSRRAYAAPYADEDDEDVPPSIDVTPRVATTSAPPAAPVSDARGADAREGTNGPDHEIQARAAAVPLPAADAPTHSRVEHVHGAALPTAEAEELGDVAPSLGTQLSPLLLL